MKSLIWIFSFLQLPLLSFAAEDNKLVTYPSHDKTPSPVFSARVNGRAVFTEFLMTVPHQRDSKGNISWRLENVSILRFAFAGKVDVELRINGEFTDYSLSPHSFGVAHERRGNIVKFSLTKPTMLNLHANHQLGEQLYIFAEALEEVPNLEDPKIKSVHNYGIDGQGKKTETKAIQAVIDNLSAGDTLFFPPGIYQTGSLRLKSRTTLHLAGGSILRGTGSKADYPDEGILVLRNVHNVKIAGHGEINANGEFLRHRKDNFADDRLRNVVIGDGSHHISIEDISLLNTPKLNVQINGDHTTLYNVKLLSNQSFENTDGADPWNCKHILYDRVLIHGRDDNIAIKGFSDTIVEDIVVRNSIFSSVESCNKVGTESLNQGFRNITFENNDLIYSGWGFSIFVWDSAVVENVWFRNLRLERLKPSPWRGQGNIFVFDLDDRNRDGKGGQIKNIRVQNVSAEQDGIKDNPYLRVGDDLNDAAVITNISFENFYIAGRLIENSNRVDYIDYLGQVQNIKAVDYRAAEFTELRVEANDLFVREGNESGFTVTRQGGDLNHTLKVEFWIRGTATNGEDYGSISASVELPAGATSATIPVKALKDNKSEGVEQVYLSLKSDSRHQYMLGPKFLAIINLLD